ncbi:MAG: LysR family transcriptional regulator [Polyangiaceae bacterium]
MTDWPKIGTIDPADMLAFAAVAEHGSFSGAARSLGIPKQTLSRRVARLEAQLNVRLLQRTTRQMSLTSVGQSYAARCQEIARLSAEANALAIDSEAHPRGKLRVTADPLLGEAFVAPLVGAYLELFGDAQSELLLTSRKVDLVQEGFDVAFRVGSLADSDLIGQRLGSAKVRYCAAPSYAGCRRLKTPEDLAQCACLAVHHSGPLSWPFPQGNTLTPVQIQPRLSSTSFNAVRDATLAGLGVALLPEFACAPLLEAGLLRDVLGHSLEVGSIWLLHTQRGLLAPRVTEFLRLAREAASKAAWHA